MPRKLSLPRPEEFDWDDGNINKNQLKHNVSFRESEEIFLNRPLKIFADYKHESIEKRYTAYGISNKKRLLTAVFTLRNKKIRIISCRDQNKKERIVYEKA